MAHLRLSWQGAALAALGLVFAVPAFAQQEGPLQPVERQAPAPPPPAPAPPRAGADPAPANPNATGSAGASSAPSTASPATPSATGAATAPAAKPSGKVEIPSGTRIPLLLHNGISTHSAKAGDPVYFETLFPIMIDGRVAIPAGSYVSGEVTESKRPGRVKGRGELMIKLNTLILTNGYQVNLNAVPHNAGTGGGETVDNEGKVIGDSDKASDAGTIAKTTAAGAGIGGIATRTGAGAGIGAGAGAAVGLMAVLLSRGPDAELPRGTTVDVVLTRPLLLDAEKDQFSGPGQASSLAGPPNREPQRNKIPF